jgi:hypothetical protein
LEFAAVHGTVILHVAEGSAAKLLPAARLSNGFVGFLCSARAGARY